MTFGISPEMQALLDATVDAVLIIDSRGRIETFNRAAERLFGYQPADVLGRNVNMLMTDRDRASHDAYMQRYQATGVPHIIGIGREVEARRRDGSSFPAFLSVGRIDGTNPPRYVGFLHDITLRRETMAAIRRERDRANTYLEVAQVILLALSTDGRVQLINRKGCEVLGRREIDLLGRDWIDSVVAPDARERVRDSLRRLARPDGEPEVYCEYEVRGPGDAPRLVAWRCVALRDNDGGLTGFLSSGEDITTRRAMEAVAERTRALLNEAQELARLGNFEVYLPGAGDDFFSPQLYRTFGLDPDAETLSVARILAMIHPDDRLRCEREWRDAMARPGSVVSEYRVVLATGEVRHLRSQFQSAPVRGGRTRLVGTLVDVTESRRADEEAAAAQQRMAHVARLATMGEMAAAIAHELNQPLSAIANFASAATRILPQATGTDVDAESRDDVRTALAQISAQALRAGEVIRRLRSLVQKRDQRREAVSINELIEEVVAFSRSDARLHNVEVRTEPCPAPPTLHADGIQIQQVVLNLVRNSIEALASGKATDREVVVRTRVERDSDIVIEVADNGNGIPQELVAQVFDPFCTTKETGTGLGLAISRSIAEAHRGSLSYCDNQPHGACFQLRLPLRAPES
ncbi:MAG: PAS domain S-box protein [Steroidobacteraceae bacterium]